MKNKERHCSDCRYAFEEDAGRGRRFLRCGLGWNGVRAVPIFEGRIRIWMRTSVRRHGMQ